MTEKYTNLLEYNKSIYSTIGNDGIIEEIFKIIGIEKGFFVEFGAWDGIKESNTRNLFDHGWQGIFIEGDRRRFKKLSKNYKKNERIVCLHKMISYNRSLSGEFFDDIMSSFLKNNKIDFCSIDVDGRDLQVFNTFKKYFPTVICIEGGQMLHPFHKEIKSRFAKRNIQQSLKVMVDLFESKGYKLLCTYQYSFFIKKEFYSKFNVNPNLIDLYFSGLKAIPRRIPFIQKCCDRVGLKNSIVDEILKRTSFEEYRWERRKEWVSEKIDEIFDAINKVKEIEKAKY